MKVRRAIYRLVWILAICVIAVTFAWLSIPPYLESVISGRIHNSLSQRLGVQASVKSVDIDLRRLKVGLYGLRIAQPDGFGSGSVLYVPEIEGSFRLSGLLSAVLELDAVSIQKGDVDLRANTNGMSNVQRLVDTFRVRLKGNGAGDVRLPEPWRSLLVRSLAAVDCAATYHEVTATSNTVEFSVVDIAVDAMNLRFVEPSTRASMLPVRHSSAATNTPGRLTATGRLRKRPFSDGMCGVMVHIGPLGDGLPTLEGSLRVIGLELAVLEPVLPANTAAILGGDAVDVLVDLGCADGSLTGRVVTETIAGYQYEATISGTLAEPTLQTDSDALAYVLSRSQGGLGNTIRNLRLAGASAASGVTDAATNLAEGTIKTVGSFGHGLVETAKGIVTLDSSDVGQGTKEMGAALTGDAKDAVFGAGGEIVQGVGEISDSLTGDEIAEEWRANIPARWTTAWRDAMDTGERASLPRE